MANSGAQLQATFNLSPANYIARAVALGAGSAELPGTVQTYPFTVVDDVPWSVPGSISIN